MLSEIQNVKESTIEKTVECVQFIDYPVFDIDGKKYSVDLEGSRMMNDVYEYLDSIDVTKAEFTLTQIRTYAVPSLNKYLNLTVSLACESVEENEKIFYVVTHMSIENAVLQDNADKSMVEPEPVQVLH